MMLVGMVMVAAMMAATMMAAVSSCGRWLAGAGLVVVSRGLGHGLLPGALQHFQLQSLLAATASQRHPFLLGDCVNPARLHRHTLLWASGTPRVLCREATLHKESTFGGTQSCWSLDQRLELLMSAGIGSARAIVLIYRKAVALRWKIVTQAADVWRVAVLARKGVRQQKIWRKWKDRKNTNEDKHNNVFLIIGSSLKKTETETEANIYKPVKL